MTKCYLAVDPAEGATTVATGREKVADLDDITVREYRGTGVEEAVRQFLGEKAVDPADVLCAVVVVEPGATHDAKKVLEEHLQTALEHAPVVFIDRVETSLRCHLAGAPTAAASAAAVLTVGDSHRGERPELDLRAAEALYAADPVCFERWAVYRLDGMVDHHLVDQEIDGVVCYPGWSTWGPDRFLVIVKGGDGHHPRMISDLAAGVEALDATGGLLLCLTPPPPEVYKAAERANATARRAGRDGVPLVQILWIPEVLNGTRPVGARQ